MEAGLQVKEVVSTYHLQSVASLRSGIWPHIKCLGLATLAVKVYKLLL